MKAPFYRFWIDDEEVTDLISSVVYEDCLFEDDLLRFVIETDNFAIADDARFQVGAQLSFQFGLIAGKTSDVHLVRISNVEISYKQVITLTITCLDMGSSMKRTTSNKIWKGQTAAQMAAEIASNYDLDAAIEPTEFIYESLAQGNRTDFELLQDLARSETNGDFRFFIKDSVLHFNTLKLENPSERTYTIGQTPTVVSFSISQRETAQQKAAVETSATLFNPLTQEQKKIEVNSANAKKQVALGNSFAAYDMNSKKLNSGSSTGTTASTNNEKKADNTGQNFVLPPTMAPVQAENLLHNAHKTESMKETTAKLVIEGDPTLKADGIVTVMNIAKVYEGNWYVGKVIHQIGSNYLTTLELSKNAINKKASKDSLAKVDGATSASLNTQQQLTPKTVNNTQGQQAGSTTQTKEIPKYDANARKK